MGCCTSRDGEKTLTQEDAKLKEALSQQAQQQSTKDQVLETKDKVERNETEQFEFPNGTDEEVYKSDDEMFHRDNSKVKIIESKSEADLRMSTKTLDLDESDKSDCGPVGSSRPFNLNATQEGKQIPPQLTEWVNQYYSQIIATILEEEERAANIIIYEEAKYVKSSESEQEDNVYPLHDDQRALSSSQNVGSSYIEFEDIENEGYIPGASDDGVFQLADDVNM